MQQFSALIIYWAGYLLENLKRECLMEGSGLGAQVFPSGLLHQSISEHMRTRAIACLKHTDDECDHIGMPITAETMREAMRRLADHESPVTYDWLMGEISNMQKLIQKEMKQKDFLYVPPEKARFFPRKSRLHVFGDAVANAFPSAVFDISEAGCCLATSRGTAAVFHLMRVLEIGLGALGKVFGVSLMHTNWAPAIEEIESKIREMHKDPARKSLPDCKAQQEFYAQAASSFGILKDAWRNYTMHSRAKYTDEEAELVFANVKAFMQKLAERLSE